MKDKYYISNYIDFHETLVEIESYDYFIEMYMHQDTYNLLKNLLSKTNLVSFVKSRSTIDNNMEYKTINIKCSNIYVSTFILLDNEEKIIKDIIG